MLKFFSSFIVHTFLILIIAIAHFNYTFARGLINHQKLLAKLNTFPKLRKQIRAWLRSDICDYVKHERTPNQQGTPQGGVISPLLSNIPSYSPVYLKDLTEFLQVCQTTGVALAVEVRHLDWYKEPHSSQLNQILTDLGIGRVLLDTRPIYNSPDNPQANSTRKKPKLPLTPVVTSDFAFVRFISHPKRKYNEAFLSEWVSHLSNWLQQDKTIYFFVHCPQEERSPDTAFYLHSLLQQQGIDLPKISKRSPESNPTQLTLF